MCQVVSTSSLHHEMMEFFEEFEPDRSVGSSYVEQFEPWIAGPREAWSDEDLEVLLRPSKVGLGSTPR